MADGIHANYAKIGFAVVAGVVAIVGTLIYLGGIGSGGREIFAETYYDNSVTGLSVGSDVNFRGVKIGEVREISFIGNKYDCAEADMQKIYILMAFDPRLFRLEDDDDWTPEYCVENLVNKGVRATVSASGITGLSHIELNFPKQDLADAPLSWKPDRLCILPSPSMLDSFSDAASKFMNHVNRMDFGSAWSNLTSVADSAARIAANVDALVDSQRAGVANIVRNIDEASRSINELTAQLKDNPSLLLRPNDPETLPETEMP